ncbi:MAG: hypothetical protein QG635_575, partial [Bacteroidota bacterium]|nr:hypothetical protein [Bacteroidota bacterium]
MSDTPISGSKGNILIVEDDVTLLSLLTRILEKGYNVMPSSSGFDAIAILKSGFKPGVIISDQIMPGMNGAEFLEKTIEYIPEATRIILTATNDPKDIISCSKKGRAYMFMSKPVDNLQLFQSAHIGFEAYKNRLRRKSSYNDSDEPDEDYSDIINHLKNSNETLSIQVNELQMIKQNLEEDNESLSSHIKLLNSTLNELKLSMEFTNTSNEDLKANLERITLKYEEAGNQQKFLEDKIHNLNSRLDEQNNLTQESALAISELVRELERFYFSDHTYHVTIITRYMAQEMKLDKESTHNLIVAALLHNITTVGMPDFLLLENPNSLDYTRRKKYFEHFNKVIGSLSKIKVLQKAARIISQIWEHRDGSGFPVGLTDDMTMIESQILSIANMSHNLVYLVQPANLKELKAAGMITQTLFMHKQRHKDAIKYLYQNSNWFDKEIVRTFNMLIKDGECQSVLPETKNLSIDLRFFYNFYVPETKKEEGFAEPAIKSEKEAEYPLIINMKQSSEKP